MTVPDGVQTIGERAFADSSLEYVKLPESLSFIADDAFNGCTDLILEVSKNSYAERWCRKNDMAYVYPASPLNISGPAHFRPVLCFRRLTSPQGLRK